MKHLPLTLEFIQETGRLMGDMSPADITMWATEIGNNVYGQLDIARQDWTELAKAEGKPLTPEGLPMDWDEDAERIMWETIEIDQMKEVLHSRIYHPTGMKHQWRMQGRNIDEYNPPNLDKNSLSLHMIQCLHEATNQPTTDEACEKTRAEIWSVIRNNYQKQVDEYQPMWDRLEVPLGMQSMRMRQILMQIREIEIYDQVTVPIEASGYYDNQDDEDEMDGYNDDDRYDVWGRFIGHL